MRKSVLVGLHVAVIACLILGGLESPVMRTVPVSGSADRSADSRVEVALVDGADAGEEETSGAAEESAVELLVNPPQSPEFRMDEFQFRDARVRFGHGAVRYSGHHGGKKQNLTYRFDKAEAGGRMIARGGAAPATVLNGVASYDRRGVTECYRDADGKLEQFFVVPAKPAADGDIVVSGRLMTNLKPITNGPDEIVLGREGVGEIRIDKAVAVDAAGRSQAMAMNYDARKHRLTMTVPAGWLADATYPIVLDPTVGSLFTVNAGIQLMDSNHVHNTSGGRFLALGSGTSGAFGQFLNGADGSASGSAFSVPSFTGGDIAFQPTSGLYLVATRGISSGAEAIIVYTINASSGAVSSPSVIYTRADTDTIGYSFAGVVAAPLSGGGWAVGFSCLATEDPEDQDDYDNYTWSVECIRLTSGAAYSAGPLVLKDEEYRDYFGAPDYYGTEDQDWDGYFPHAATITDSSTDRFCMTWHEYRSYDPDESGDSDIGSDRYRVSAAVVSVNTMALLRQWSLETEEVSFESDSYATVEGCNVAGNDADNEFLITWDRANFDGWYGAKARRHNSSGSGVGGDFYIKGAASQSSGDYYHGDLVWSAIAPSGTGSTFFMTFRSAGNIYAKELPGASATVPSADISIATTTASEFTSLSAINRTDTRVLITLNTGGQMYEIRTVSIPPTITTTSLADATRGTAYSATLAYTGGSGSPTWSVTAGTLPAGLSLGASTGVISGTPTTTGASTFTVQVSAGGTDTQPLTLTVVGPPTPVVTALTLPDRKLGETFAIGLQFTGATGSATWAVASGTLPLGTALNTSTGVLGGTPTKTGKTTFSVTVTVGGSTSAAVTMTMKIKKTSLISLTKGKVAVAYTTTLMTTGGSGSTSFSVTTGMLPAGLSLNGSTGVISGTPTLNGTFKFTIRHQAGGTDYLRDYKLTIRR